MAQRTARSGLRCDVTYGTNNEFGFDYLRDNLEIDAATAGAAGSPLRHRGRGRHHPRRRGADPADHIAALPSESVKCYRQFAQVAPRLKPDEDYEVEEKSHTRGDHRGRHPQGGEDARGGEPLRPRQHAPGPPPARCALKAKELYQSDVDYVVKDGEVIIVDEFTGRLMPGRRCSDGLHQAVEAKERREGATRRTRRWPPSPCRTTSACTTSWRA